MQKWQHECTIVPQYHLERIAFTANQQSTIILAILLIKASHNDLPFIRVWQVQTNLGQYCP